MRTDNEYIDRWITQLNATGHADIAQVLHWLRTERDILRREHDLAQIKPGTWVRKTGGDYEAEGQIVGSPMLMDNGVVRYNLAIRRITKGRLIHVVNPAHLVEIDPPQEQENGR